MRIDRTVTITLTCDEVADILKKHASEHTGLTVNDAEVQFDVGIVYSTPAHPDDGGIHKLKGATITCTPKVML